MSRRLAWVPLALSTLSACELDASDVAFRDGGGGGTGHAAGYAGAPDPGSARVTDDTTSGGSGGRSEGSSGGLTSGGSSEDTGGRSAAGGVLEGGAGSPASGGQSTSEAGSPAIAGALATGGAGGAGEEALECHFAGPCTSVARDAEGNIDTVTTLEYDADGRLLSETVRDSEEFATVTTYRYDDQGRLLQQKNDQCEGEGWCIWMEYAYDEHSNLTTMLDYSMYSGRENSCEHYSYNELNLRIQAEIDTGCTGNVSSTVRSEYDTEGRLISRTVDSSTSSTQTLYRYDASRRLLSEETLRDGVTDTLITHEYDTAGNEVRETYQCDFFTSYEVWTHDASGNPLTREEHMVLNGVEDPVQTWYWSYDASGNLTDEHLENADASKSQCRTWTYDGCENTLTATYSYACDNEAMTTVHDYACFL